MVKMFSRDKEDAALFERVKKGMWVKVEEAFKMIRLFVILS